MPLRDIIDLTELNCGACGGVDVIFTCDDHGKQEAASLKKSNLCCIEYDYVANGECSQLLAAFCNDCDCYVPVEGLG